MKKVIRTIEKLAIAGLLTFCASTSMSYAASLNAKQIENTYVGHSYTFKTKKDQTGTIQISKKGKVKLSKTNFSLKKDSGTWRIKGNKFCNTWKKIRNGKEACFSISKIGENAFKDSVGTIITRK
jgi:hypothetical protein